MSSLLAFPACCLRSKLSFDSDDSFWLFRQHDGFRFFFAQHGFAFFGSGSSPLSFDAESGGTSQQSARRWPAMAVAFPEHGDAAIREQQQRPAARSASVQPQAVTISASFLAHAKDQ